jgi:hypothetical protein
MTKVLIIVGACLLGIVVTFFFLDRVGTGKGMETTRELRERDQLIRWAWKRGDTRDKLSWVLSHVLVALAIAALLALVLFRQWVGSY